MKFTLLPRKSQKLHFCPKNWKIAHRHIFHPLYSYHSPICQIWSKFSQNLKVCPRVVKLRFCPYTLEITEIKLFHCQTLKLYSNTQMGLKKFFSKNSHCVLGWQMTILPMDSKNSSLTSNWSSNSKSPY